MNRLHAVSVGISLAAMVSLSASARDVVPGAESIDKVVQSEGQAFVDKALTDGLSIAVVRDGKTMFYNFGTVSREKPARPDENTVYEIASVSKTFASLLLAKAIVDGKAAPEDDVRKYLPEGYANLQKEGRPVRLIDLVTTTSGLPDNLPSFESLVKGNDPDQKPLQIASGLATYSVADLLRDLKGVTVEMVPGSTRAHSNLGGELVGIVVSRIYGTTYEEALATHIEKPLGMKSGTSGSRQALLAKGYDEKHAAPMPYLTGQAILPAAGLEYSAADMARYIGAQLKASDAAIALTHKPAWGEVNRSAIGYNWSVANTMDGEKRLSHTGGSFGFASFVDLYPESHYGIAILSNHSGPKTQGELVAMSERIMQRVWGESPAFSLLKQQIAKRGFDHIEEAVAATRARYPRMNLSESDVNVWGYQLLAGGHTKDAVAVFTYNTKNYPTSYNAFDSLAEAQRASGDKANAIANYRRSLALEPKNENARKVLAEMDTGTGE